ncbi:MAG: hypothetical protein ACR2NU_13975 [Aeoliella sp.]
MIDSFVPFPTDTFTVLTSSNLIDVLDNANSGQRTTTADGLGSFVANYGASSPFDANHIVLSDFFGTGLDGDINNDGFVDAADYTKWRDNLGASAGALFNNIDGGMIGMAHFATWRGNFGATIGRASVLLSPVPESLGLVLMLGGLPVVRIGRVAAI